MAAEYRHASDGRAIFMAFNHLNQRQSGMEVAVTAVLADVLGQLTARDAFGDRRILSGFKPSRRTASQAAGGPHSAGIPDRRR